MGTTAMWTIEEAPGYTVEKTPGAWVLWGPCEHAAIRHRVGEVGLDAEACPSCGGTGEMIIDTCGFVDNDGCPADPDMIGRNLGLTRWTPTKVQ